MTAAGNATGGRTAPVGASRLSIATGALLGALGVIAGAFAAHALRGRLPPEALALVDTGSRYQLIHALALVAVGVLHMIRPSFAARLSAASFAAGVLLFCGSLYALAFGAPRALGMITPIGGVLLITGWLTLAISAWHRVTRSPDGAH
jgi:uncharacterized membrane protein YgdD (TMEM256/DUF423 family)